jgi:hypothetical protein
MTNLITGCRTAFRPPCPQLLQSHHSVSVAVPHCGVHFAPVCDRTKQWCHCARRVEGGTRDRVWPGRTPPPSCKLLPSRAFARLSCLHLRILDTVGLRRVRLVTIQAHIGSRVVTPEKLAFQKKAILGEYSRACSCIRFFSRARV